MSFGQSFLRDSKNARFNTHNTTHARHTHTHTTHISHIHMHTRKQTNCTVVKLLARTGFEFRCKDFNFFVKRRLFGKRESA